MDGWMDGWLKKLTAINKLNKPNMSKFSKFKLLLAIKLNFNAGQFYKVIGKSQNKVGLAKEIG